jgi:hypothetical protein
MVQRAYAVALDSTNVAFGGISQRPCAGLHHPQAPPSARSRGSGAAWGTRTHDPIITNDVLYQLS